MLPSVPSPLNSFNFTDQHAVCLQHDLLHLAVPGLNDGVVHLAILLDILGNLYPPDGPGRWLLLDVGSQKDKNA